MHTACNILFNTAPAAAPRVESLRILRVVCPQNPCTLDPADWTQPFPVVLQLSPQFPSAERKTNSPRAGLKGCGEDMGLSIGKLQMYLTGHRGALRKASPAAQLLGSGLPQAPPPMASPQLILLTPPK